MESTMLLEKTDISEEIEQLRKVMNRLGAKYGILHPDVIRCSQQLDKLLLQFYRSQVKADIPVQVRRLSS